jgi:betaine/carnitine transporter, BCCT family
VLIFYPVGKVRIGGKDARPDYSYAGWIAMMFAAGIGIGLLFFGVLEPVYYNFAEGRAANPLGIGVDENEYISIVGTIHHWGLEGWAVYAAVGLHVAYSIEGRSGISLDKPNRINHRSYPIHQYGQGMGYLRFFSNIFD